MNLLGTSLRSAARSLARSRSQSVAIVLTLALGLGATTTMVSVVDALFFRPFPFADSDRLVVIHNRYGHGEEAGPTLSSPPDYKDRLDYSRTLSSMAAWRSGNVNLTGRGEPMRLRSGRATASLLDTLAVTPRHGRWFTGSEEASGTRVAVLSSRVAKSLFGAEESAIGSDLVLDDEAHEVIGVMFDEFDFAPTGADLWLPLHLTPASFSNEQRGNEYLTMIGRLAGGATIADANAEMQSIADGVLERDPSRASFLTEAGWGAIVRPLREELYGELRKTSLFLFAFVVILLFLSLMNATQLSVVRALRMKEALAVREALGATRSHIAGQFFGEAVILGIAGAAIGLAIPLAVFGLVEQHAPVEVLRGLDLTIDLRVVALAFTIAIGCALIAGVAPLIASRGSLSESLSSGRGRTNARGATRLRSLVTIAEVALSFVLIAAGISIWQNVSELLEIDPGFTTDNIVTMQIALPRNRYEDPQVRQFVGGLLGRLDSSPGVNSSAIVTQFPMANEEWTGSFRLADRPELESAGGNLRVASPSYFSVMEIPLRRGELFGDTTDPGLRQLVIDEAAARRYWPGSDPVGKQITFSGPDASEIRWWRIVGVVGSIHESLEREPEPHVYLPYAQLPQHEFFVAARLRGQAGDARSLFRSVVRELDPSLPIWNVTTAETHLERALALHRFRLTTLWVFGVAGLLLSALGVYGVVAFAFATAKMDHAIRMTFGATRGDLVRMGLTQVSRLIGSGLIVGFVTLVGIRSIAESWVAGVEISNPTAMAASAVVVGLIVFAAAMIPAVRSSKIDPMEILRTT